jgi:hypothetical protein
MNDGRDMLSFEPFSTGAFSRKFKEISETLAATGDPNCNDRSVITAGTSRSIAIENGVNTPATVSVCNITGLRALLIPSTGSLT